MPSSLLAGTLWNNSLTELRASAAVLLSSLSSSFGCLKEKAVLKGAAACWKLVGCAGMLNPAIKGTAWPLYTEEAKNDGLTLPIITPMLLTPMLP